MKIISKVNGLLHDECKRNKFQFVNNDNITREDLWRDGLHLNSGGTYIFASNLFDFLNNLFFNKTILLTEDDNAAVGKDKHKQSFDSSDDVKHNTIDDDNNVINHEKVTEKNSDFFM